MNEQIQRSDVLISFSTTARISRTYATRLVLVVLCLEARQGRIRTQKHTERGVCYSEALVAFAGEQKRFGFDMLRFNGCVVVQLQPSDVFSGRPRIS